MSSTVDSSNAVSKAISAAATTNTTTQTRFSFYDAHEVQLQISASENKDSASLKSSSPPDVSNTNSNNTSSITNNNSNNNNGTVANKQSSRKELATVDSNTIGLNVVTTTHTPNNANITATATTDSQGTEEILRSLQETEEQRMQLLGGVNTTKETRKPSQVPQDREQPGASSTLSQPSSSADQASNDSNPYEDAIKEALNLLRRHRSPAASPAIAAAKAPGFPQTVALEGGIRARTPRDKPHSFHSDENEHINAMGNANPNSNTMTDAIPATKEELTDAYEEAKLKAKQRQERMAKYASRLQEFKSGLNHESAMSSTPTNTTWQISKSYSNHEDDNANKDTSYRDTLKQVGTNDDSVGFSDLSQSTTQKQQREEEVQRGVERVLLAILERANSSRGRADDRSEQASTTLTYPSASQLSQESMGDTLIRAMDELLLGPTTTTAPTRMQHQNKEDEQQHIEGLKTNSRDTDCSVNTGNYSKNSKSVVDELLAEVDEEEDDAIIPTAIPAASPASTGIAMMGQAWPGHHQHREEKKLPDSMEKENQTTILNEDQSGFHSHTDVDELVQGFLGSPDKDDSPDSDDGEDIDDEADEEDDNDDYNEMEHEDGDNDDGHCLQENNGRVLGPLSKKAGGTTGVVLDIEEENNLVDDSANALGPFSHVMNYVTSALTPEQREAQERHVMKHGQHQHHHHHSAEQDDHHYHRRVGTGAEVDDEDDDNANDSESMELMRTLCAHLLPFGVDPSNSLLDAIPDWDDSNPNEAGYRIIRLSRSQLRRVECAFETMINGFKATSERRLNGIDPSLHDDDANFVKELREAEKLLDDEEKRRQLAESIKSTSASGKMPLVPGALQIDGEVDRESAIGVASALCHPDFPGIRATGKGEMGDLEYFHLPIIFKSHVTGFEPTKDLVLEPGNVVASQYLVESELGSAAFSTAYRCVDLSSDGEDGHEEVCLKVIKNTKDFFDQSLDEIKILELLRQTGRCHENHCVEMKTFFYYREHLVIVTELLRQNLFEFGKFILDNDEEPYFTIPRLAYITRQALIALKFVHSLGLVHSDVKPENILLGSYSRAQIKLIDFGSSCYLTDRQSSYIQSRSYRAPEVVLGLPYDGRIDVWSLGCVVAEMYTGEVTFQNDSIVSMLSRIEAICGPFPRHMIAQGRQSGRFFTKSGLLYEFVDDSDREGSRSAPGPHDDSDDENDTSQFDIFQPKKTRLSARLGFTADLMDGFSEDNYRTRPSNPERQEQQMFTDFVSRLLTIDPDGRPTAAEALKHPWMQYAASLTEEQIKYPSS